MGWMRVEVNTSVLRNNLRAVKGLLSKGTGVAAVVKSGAYGHGMLEAASVFVEEGVDMLAVSLLHEGVELREAGFHLPLLLLGGIFPEEAEEVVARGLSPVVSSVASIRELSKAAARLGKVAGFHLKVDTGMGRRGCGEEELHQLLQQISMHQGLVMEGLVSHLSVADVEGEDARLYTLGQLERFKTVVAQVRGSSFTPRWIHIANSAAIVSYPESHHSLVRPGIVLYGGLAGFQAARQAMRVSTRLVEVRRVKKGACISYGRTFVAPRDMVLGIAPVGYATGYLRGLSNRGEALVGGKRVPVVGTVCMDLTLLDLSSLPGTQVGDEVVLLGTQGGEEISVFEVADWLGTITYEVFCLLGNNPFAERCYL